MVLGIKLLIDKASVQSATKELRGGAEKVGKKIKGTEPIEVGKKEKKKKDKEKEKSAFSGAAIGGFIGAIIGSLKPIQELLSVIGGILQIFMVPIMILLKPFLVLFLKVGIALNKWLTKQNKTTAQKAGNIGGIILAALTAILLIVTTALGGWAIALIALIVGFAGKYIIQAIIWIATKLFEFGTKIGQWLFDKIIVPVGDAIYNAIIWVVEFIKKAWEWIKDVAKNIKNWIITAFKNIVEFFKSIPGLFLEGLSFIADLGVKIWNFFLDGLSFISNLGVKIWNWIKDSLGNLFGVKGKASGGPVSGGTPYLVGERGPELFMPSSSGNIVPNFKTFNSGGNGGSGARNINITVNGFVGDEDTLAYKISKALNEGSRGSVANY